MRFECLLFFFLLALGCGEKAEADSALPVISDAKLQEELVQVNQRQIQEEQWLIKKYLERRKLAYERKGTGLHMVRVSAGNSNLKPKPGDWVAVQYQAFLLDGSPCFSSLDSAEVFRLAYDPIESGLQDGILNMEVGEECLLLIPSHLAFGLVGDLEKIPPYTPVAYRVKLIQIKE
jgi:FKBP-type peptidyl-prolyl cis-trans isomerase